MGAYLLGGFLLPPFLPLCFCFCLPEFAEPPTARAAADGRGKGRAAGWTTRRGTGTTAMADEARDGGSRCAADARLTHATAAPVGRVAHSIASGERRGCGRIVRLKANGRREWPAASAGPDALERPEGEERPHNGVKENQSAPCFAPRMHNTRSLCAAGSRAPLLTGAK